MTREVQVVYGINLCLDSCSLTAFERRPCVIGPKNSISLDLRVECDAFSELRRDIFQTLEDLTDLTKITDHQLGRFIAESNYNWFFEEEEPEDPG